MAAKFEGNICYLENLLGSAKAVPYLNFVGKEGWKVQVPFLAAIAVSPVLMAAVSGRCPCDPDVVVVFPGVSTRSIEMLVDFIMGESIYGGLSDLHVLEKLCRDLGIEFAFGSMTGRDESVTVDDSDEEEDMESTEDADEDQLQCSTNDANIPTIDISEDSNPLSTDSSHVRLDDDAAQSFDGFNAPRLRQLLNDMQEETNTFSQGQTTELDETCSGLEQPLTHGEGNPVVTEEPILDVGGPPYRVYTDHLPTLREGEPGISQVYYAENLDTDGSQIGVNDVTYGVYVGDLSTLGATAEPTGVYCARVEDAGCSGNLYEGNSHQAVYGLQALESDTTREFLLGYESTGTSQNACVANGMHPTSEATLQKDKNFRCRTCGKCFVTETGWQMHESSHGGITSFKCRYCEKSFVSQKSRHRHEASHFEENRRFKCSFCEKSFPSRYHCQRHVYTHTGEKPYSCAHCNTRFSRSDHLSLHMRTHSQHK